VDLPSASLAGFYGFAAGPGEHITTFHVNASVTKALPGLDNVTIGNSGPAVVPIPGAAILGMIGMATSAHVLRRRRKKAVTTESVL